jgi:integrase
VQGQTVTVEHSWDDVEGEIAPKSQAGTRTVFVADILLPFLEPLVKRRGKDAFVFGTAAPFEPRPVARKATRAWDAADERRVKEKRDALVRFTLHECRHSFSTFLDHAGVSEARADRYMGHSSSAVAGRYRHLLPAQLAEDRKAFDAYFAGTAAGKVVALAG